VTPALAVAKAEVPGLAILSRVEFRPAPTHREDVVFFPVYIIKICQPDAVADILKRLDVGPEKFDTLLIIIDLYIN
jgi:hypothetical protein